MTTLYTAAAIGIVIGLIAFLPSIRLKAIVYSLPIPISIAIVGARSNIDGTNIIGLGLVCVFIWSVKKLHTRRWPIIPSVIAAIMVYILLGFISKQLSINFWISVGIYVVIWLVTIVFFRTHPIQHKTYTPSTISPLLKAGGAGIISYMLLSVQHLIAGAAVTFPYSGIFATVETRHHLEQFFRSVVRNLLAIVGLFCAMYVLQDHLPTSLCLTFGWLVELPLLFLLQRVKV